MKMPDKETCPIFDINVHLGCWHNQRLPYTSPLQLQKKLNSLGIRKAFVSSNQAIFYSDPEPGNLELLNKVKRYPLFVPVPVFNPNIPNSEEILRKYSKLKIKIIKLFPSFHNYSLNSEKIKSVLKFCLLEGFIILIQMRMEDERLQHPTLKTNPLDIDKILEIAEMYPSLPIICLSGYFNECVRLAQNSSNIYLDISFAERLDTINALLDVIPLSRIVFGSHTPFFYPESALLKVESSEIPLCWKEHILYKNIETLMEER
jgi:hypothetical protein